MYTYIYTRARVHKLILCTYIYTFSTTALNCWRSETEPVIITTHADEKPIFSNGRNYRPPRPISLGIRRERFVSVRNPEKRRRGTTGRRLGTVKFGPTTSRSTGGAARWHRIYRINVANENTFCPSPTPGHGNNKRPNGSARKTATAQQAIY